MSPATARNTAGAAAQRWGWLLNRTESTASNAQPRASASSTTPVRMFSFAGMKGAATRARAATSPAANDAATINPMRPSRWGGTRADGWRLGSWAVVAMWPHFLECESDQPFRVRRFIPSSVLAPVATSESTTTALRWARSTPK